jgi:hypothetical protein
LGFFWILARLLSAGSGEGRFIPIICKQTFTDVCVYLHWYFNTHFTAMYRLWIKFEWHKP